MAHRDWRSLKTNKPNNDITAGIVMLGAGIYATVKYILYFFGTPEWFGGIVGGLALIFFFPFLVFGGWTLIVEGIQKARANRQKRKASL